MTLVEILTPRGFLDLLQARIADLADEEMAWEPVAGCMRLGDGQPRVTHFDGVADPVTTIGWRLDHVAGGITAERIREWLSVDVAVPVVRAHDTAASMRAWIATAADWWTSLVESMDDAHLQQPMGVGPFADAPRAGFVVHLNNELIHHGAEVGVLRDLWRAGLR